MKKVSIGTWISTMLMVMVLILAGCSSGSGEAPKGETAESESVKIETAQSETAESEPAGETVKIACENGVMLGKTVDGVTSFKGVPYAKAPTGDLRWRAPQSPDPSEEEIECFDFGYTALQYEWPTEPASSFPKNEDCLTLNIWESQGANESGEARPVMVFFHGGAYGWGGTTDPMYDGQNFAAAHDDVILITCNYRLGLMSWADFSQIEGGEDYTDINLGIRDHIAALQWIQKNIAAFGGDPDNVTIFGESAGGWSTTALTISPAAKGLFKRAIAQSGGMPVRDREAAQEFANVIMEAADAENMDDLLAISGDEWMKLDMENWIADECCGIVADGEIIPEEADMEQAIAEAARSGIQMIVGTNNDEWNYFQEDSEGDTEEEKFASWVEGMDAMYEEASEELDQDGKDALEELIRYEESLVPEEYAEKPEVKAALAKSGFVTESWRYDILHFADRFADAGGQIYAYLWKVPSTLDSMYRSSVHAVELAYLFNNPDVDIYAGHVDMDTAAKAQEAWTNFAKTGDPSIEGVTWQAYKAEDRQTMVIEKEDWKCLSDPSKTARELLSRAYGDKPYQVW